MCRFQREYVNPNVSVLLRPGLTLFVVTSRDGEQYTGKKN